MTGAPPETPFSRTAWDRSASLRRRIDELAFNRELAAGTLSRDRFRFYIVQDALYLEGYARTLAVAAARAPDSEAMQRFAHAAGEALVVERALHRGFFESFGLDPEEALAAEPSPTCAAYVNFLLATAHVASYEELVAAVLPCFWVYWDVGERIAATASGDNPYRAWIETYSDPAFGDAVKAVIAIADRAAAAASPACRDAMLEAFMRSTRYEWMFWDSAWRCESWPVDIGN